MYKRSSFMWTTEVKFNNFTRLQRTRVLRVNNIKILICMYRYFALMNVTYNDKDKPQNYYIVVYGEYR